MIDVDIVTRARELLKYNRWMEMGEDVHETEPGEEIVRYVPPIIRKLIAKIEELWGLEESAIERGNKLQADNDRLRGELDEHRLKIAWLKEDRLRDLQRANEDGAGITRKLVDAQMVLQSIRDLKVTELSPLDALTTLFELQRKAKGE